MRCTTSTPRIRPIAPSRFSSRTPLSSDLNSRLPSKRIKPLCKVAWKTDRLLTAQAHPNRHLINDYLTSAPRSILVSVFHPVLDARASGSEAYERTGRKRPVPIHVRE